MFQCDYCKLTWNTTDKLYNKKNSENENGSTTIK